MASLIARHQPLSLRWRKQTARIPVHREKAEKQESGLMSDAQIGLVMATPLIIIFAVMLHWMGVLRLSGTIAAVTLSIVIAMSLFFTQ
jgi:hypothetical protein